MSLLNTGGLHHDGICRCLDCRKLLTVRRGIEAALEGVPGEWDAGGGFASLCEQATDSQLIAFLDLVRDEVNERIRKYQERGELVAANALWDVARRRLQRDLVW